jgi:trans-aconitate methyltransferase
MEKPQINWNSNDYRNNSSAQTQWAMDLVSRIGVKEDSVILDIGCGDGRVTRELARLAHRGTVVGIDASEDMIRLARQSFGDVPNLRFVQMDAREIDLPERFGIAFSNAALHWVTDQDRFLSSLHRHMRPGGTLHFNFGGKGNGQDVFKAVFSVVMRPEWKCHFPQIGEQGSMKLPYLFLSDDAYRQLLLTNGFEPISVSLTPRDMFQNGTVGLAGWIRTTWMPLTNRVPEELREKLIGEVVEEYLKTHPLEDGKAVVRMIRLEVHARTI